MGRKKKIFDQEILVAARECFEEHGYAVSLDLIARQLGVTAPVLFSRFGTKLNLFYEAMLPDHFAAMFYFDSLRYDPEQRADEQLREIAVELIGLSREMNEVADIFARNAVALHELNHILQIPAPPPVIDALVRWLEGALQAGAIIEVERRAVGEAMLGMAHAMTSNILRQAAQGKPAALEGLAEHVATIFWRMLEPDRTNTAQIKWPDQAVVKALPARSKWGDVLRRDTMVVEDLSDATALTASRMRKHLPLNGSVMFDFNQTGVIFVEVQNGVNVVDNMRRKADCTMHMAFTDFCDLENGLVASPELMHNDRIRVDGDVSLALEMYNARVGTPA
ncbi:MAG: TetR family transcriptional regulator [Sphingomonadaceae bacterium]|nr:TetR family transcriptional regulator [Sphingomonadaceae bacterium]